MRPYLLIFSVLLTNSLLTFAQNKPDFASKVVKQFDNYVLNLPHEKVYVHTDKPYYATGDTLWLKAYITDANSLKPDTVSSVLRVDLVANSGKVVRFYSLKMRGGGAAGFVPLDSLPSGMYRLRAYTNWMRNFSEAGFFEKTVQIFDPQLSVNVPPFDSTALDLQFFPEGGQLVAGLVNRVAFKATNALGRGADIEGFVLSAAGDTVVGFASRHLGMGYLSLEPAPDQTYKAYFRQNGGKWLQAALPKPQPNGFTVQVDNFTNKANVRIIVSQNVGGTAEESATMVIHGKGEIGIAVKLPLTRKTSLLNAARAQLNAGVNHLTIFDAAGRPVCERLFWLPDSNRLQISVLPKKSTYRPREKVELDIMVKDAKNQPVQADFSLVVTDAVQVRELEKQPQNIVSYLWLASEVKGTIEQPAAYFDPKNSSAALNLDYLLMTQGWRRFKWQDVLQDSLPRTAYFVEQGMALTGKITKLNGKSPGTVNLTIFINAKDSARSLFMGESDEQGSFGFYNLNFADSVTVLLQGVTPKGNRDLVIQLDRPQPPAALPANLNNNLESAAVEEYLKRLKDYLRIEAQIRKSGEQMLQEIVIKAKKAPIPDGRKIYSSADATLKSENFSPAAFNAFELLQGRVAGVNVTGSGQNIQVNIRGAANFSGAIEPLYLLDGTPVSRDAILGIPVTDLESIDVLKGPSASLFGSQGAGGVLAFFTKRGSPNYDVTTEKAPGTLVTKMMGYQTEREFYAPKYDTKPTFDRPDFRSTLLWLPRIQTNANGQATVTFYHSDATNKAQINVQGLAPNGQVGAAVGSYDLK